MSKRHVTWSGLYLALVFVILYAPIIYLVVFSFSAGTTMERITAFRCVITRTSLATPG